MSTFETDAEKQVEAQSRAPAIDDGYTTTDTSKQDGSINDENPPSADATPGADLDWEGPDDPAFPHNWPKGKRVFNTFIPSLMALLVFVLVPTLPLQKY